MTDKKRDKNGKFAAKQKPPENPDCEPATKGYVKCLIRKTKDHNHPQDSKYFFTGVTAIIGWFCVFLSIFPPTPPSLLSAVAVQNQSAMIAFSAACTVFCIDMIRMDDETTGVNSDPIGRIYRLLKKYERPVCKDKEVCED